ncbi:MAG: hypothetical protein LBF12_06240 [Christensenellaceae bacterium]|jgi:hypothetical protein|nr:hypothetical protein [Christensenellaceae bacterium]
MLINCSHCKTTSTITARIVLENEEVKRVYSFVYNTEIGANPSKELNVPFEKYLKIVDIKKFADKAIRIVYDNYRDQIVNGITKWAEQQTKHEPNFDFLRLIILTTFPPPYKVFNASVDTLAFEVAFDYIKNLKFTSEQLSKLPFDFKYNYDFDKYLASRIENFIYFANVHKLEITIEPRSEPINNESIVEFEYFFETLNGKYILTDGFSPKNTAICNLPYSKLPDFLKNEFLGMKFGSTKKIRFDRTPDLFDEKIFTPLFLNPDFSMFKDSIIINIEIKKHLKFVFSKFNDDLVSRYSKFKTVNEFINFHRIIYKFKTMFTLNTNALSKLPLNIFHDFKNIPLPEIEFDTSSQLFIRATSDIIFEYQEEEAKNDPSSVDIYKCFTRNNFLKEITTQLEDYSKRIHLYNSIFANLNLNITIPQLIIENLICKLLTEIDLLPCFVELPNLDDFSKELLELLNDLIAEFENELPKIKNSYQIDGVETVRTFMCDFGNSFNLTFSKNLDILISKHFKDNVVFNTPQFKKTNLYKLIVRAKKYFTKPIKIKMFLNYGEPHEISPLHTAMARTHIMQHSFEFNFSSDPKQIDFFS